MCQVARTICKGIPNTHEFVFAIKKLDLLCEESDNDTNAQVSKINRALF